MRDPGNEVVVTGACNLISMREISSEIELGHRLDHSHVRRELTIYTMALIGYIEQLHCKADRHAPRPTCQQRKKIT